MNAPSHAACELLTDGTVSRRPFWLPTDGPAVAAWLHHPSEGHVRMNGVVLCPAFGHEYAHSHRSCIHLSDQLAAAGHVVLRLDYPGTGDSAGDESEARLVDLWLDAVDDALDFVERLTGGAPASIVGLRLGALLAGIAASRRDVHSWVGWAPVLSGRRFMRAARALHLLSSGGDDDDQYLQAGGFQISPATGDALSGLTFPGQDTRIVTRALVVDRADQPLGARLPTQERIGVPVDRLEQSDYLDMMAEPHFTRVPTDTIGGIVEWMSDQSPARRTELDACTLERVCAARQASPELDFTEEVAIVNVPGETSVFGVLCLPGAGRAGEEIVLLPNAGSVHHVGPNRLYVELARALVAEGIPSFRFDLQNLGDGRIGPNAEENHPYPSSAVRDVESVAWWLTTDRGFASCIVAGLCSGAHTAFHAGIELEDQAISSIISINPLTFRFTRGTSLATPATQQTTRDALYYREAMRSPEKWFQLLRDWPSIRRVLAFLGHRVVQLTKAESRRVLRLLGLRGPRRLEKDLARLDELGRPIHFVFSSSDPGQEVLAEKGRPTSTRLARKGQISVSIVAGADHTFSKRRHRREAIDLIVRHLLRRDATPLQEDS